MNAPETRAASAPLSPRSQERQEEAERRNQDTFDEALAQADPGAAAPAPAKQPGPDADA